MGEVALDQADRDRLERTRGGGDLGQHVDAVGVVFHHAVHATHLSLDPAQSPEKSVLLRRVPVVSHPTSVPPGGIKWRIQVTGWFVEPVVPATRSLRSVLSGAVLLAIVLAEPAGPNAAHADPSRGDLSQQLSVASQQLETVIEQYDSGQVRLNTTQARQAGLAAQLVPVARAVTELENQVGRYAAGLYKQLGGGPLTALVTAGSPPVLLDQMTTLEHLGVLNERQLTNLKTQQRQYGQQRAGLDTLLAQQRAQQSDLVVKRTRIETQIAHLTQLRYALYGGRPPAHSFDRFVPTYQPGPAGAAIRYAYAQLGKAYQWGAAGPGTFDCSGLTMASWHAAGVNLPHSAALQWAQVPHVSRSQLQPGDLVFYYGNIHHVAMYLGAGKVIHAPTYGEDVTIAPVDVGPVHGYGRPT